MNRPACEFKDKGCKVTVWQTRNGGYIASPVKNFKKDDTWETRSSFFRSEMRTMIELMLKAADWLDANEKSNGQFIEKVQEASTNEATASNFSDDDIPF